MQAVRSRLADLGKWNKAITEESYDQAVVSRYVKQHFMYVDHVSLTGLTQVLELPVCSSGNMEVQTNL